MDFNEYEDSVKEWISQVTTSRIENTDVSKKYCKMIIDHAKTSDDDCKLYGFAYYYLAESYFVENQYEKFIKNLIRGLEYQQKASLGKLIARSYNMLGINSDNQGNISAAIDYYLTSLKYSQIYELNHEAGIVYTNIGQIYVMLQEYKTAIEYLEKAMECFSNEEKGSHYYSNAVITVTTLATCYLRLEDMDSALYYFNKIEDERDRYLDENHYQMVILCFEVIFYDALGEYEKRDILIDQLIELVDDIPSLLDMYDEAFVLCEFLQANKRYDDLLKVIERIDKLTKQAGITNMQLRVLKLKIQYYKLIQDEKAYLGACSDYYILTDQLEGENKTNTKRAIELRVDLERIKEKQDLMLEENKLLLEKSERDPLTKLPNREKLNDYSEKAFNYAYENGTRLGVEIFDIDHFKLYNDTYGHQAGDKCLKKIAKLLHSLMEKGIFCARYGGDEFIIIYENMSDSEILEIAKKLQQDVIDMNLKVGHTQEYMTLTISQGIRNSIPKAGNKIWDYFYVADMSMYKVKNAKKNDILLLHKAV
jgi:diguanylate cyclase (GGDEF)-like protein